MALEQISSTLMGVPPQSVLSHYEIVRKLGEGGMGVVYQARDTELGRLVALKFLSSHVVSSAEKVARFRQEARAISALNHPHIATIYGMEDTGEYKFLVLEYLPGGNLQQKLSFRRSSGDRLSIQQATAWAIQIAEGLEHAHRHGIIHRDIKSSNVLFTEDGQIKIADFGLAKIEGADEEEPAVTTQSGCTMGTPVYMSPEQAQGLQVDERSDIFSLGILYFELLAGERPFHGRDIPKALHDIVYTPAPALSQFREGVPDAVQAVVSKALEKNPDDRYQSVSEFLAALRVLFAECGATSNGSWQETISLASPIARKRPWGRIVLACALVAGVATPAAVPNLRLRTLSWLHPQPIPAEKRIAVLLFSNIGADPANQALADGLVEVVSNSLSRLEQFHGALLVVPASDVRNEHVASARDAGRLLGANLAITGSVLRTDGNVQVMLNLVDTRTVTQLRTETIKARLPELASLQDGVVDKVAGMLELVLQPEAEQSLRAGDPEVAGAYPFYVEGLGALHRNDRPENLDKAVDAFKRAIAMDSKYVLAYAGLAQAYWSRFDTQRDTEALEVALANGAKALSLNGQLAPVHVTMGMILAGKERFEAAADEFGKALKLDPRSPDAYRGLAATYEARGQASQAEATYQRALALRPGDWWSLKQMGVFYFHQRRYSEAEQYFRKVIQITPESAKAYSNLGSMYVRMGRHADAVAQFQKSIDIEPNANAYNALGYVEYFEGRYAEAAAQFEKAITLVPTDSRFWGGLADAYRFAPALSPKAPDTYRRAIEVIGKEIAANPEDARLHSRVATYWAALGERTKASAESHTALRLAPYDGYVQFRTAIVLEQAQRRDEALRALQAALRDGQPLEEIAGAPVLADLRADKRFVRMAEAARRANSNPK